MKKIFAITSIFLVAFSTLTVFSPKVNTQPTTRAQSVQEFWLPLTLPQGWPANDFVSGILIVALQDSVFTVDGGTAMSLSANQTYLYPNPNNGSHVVVQSGRIMAFYHYLINDYGIWDDARLGYTLLPASQLGTSYIIPIGGAVGVVAIEPSTTVYSSESPDPLFLANAGDTVQFVLPHGSWVEADRPIAVAVGNTDASTKSDTWSYTAFPNNFIGNLHHFGKHVPMDPSFPNQLDQSKIAIMATDLGANVEINGVAQPPLASRELMTLNNPSDDIQISSDNPTSVVYLQKIRHDDPWTGALRYTSYAQSLIPKYHWGMNFWLIGLKKTHLITEETVNVEIDSTTQNYSPGVYDLGTLSRGTSLTSDKPVTIEQIGASDWAGMHYHPQGEACETFPMDLYEKAEGELVEVDLDPDTLNLRSKGKWITAYTELQEGYNVSDIDVSTILLNNSVSAETHPTGIGDEDGDSIPDLMVKFDRASVIDYIKGNIDWSNPVRSKPYTYEVTLTVTGSLPDGSLFEGSDTIRVLQFLKGDPEPL